jgi:hypothetical protein
MSSVTRSGQIGLRPAWGLLYAVFLLAVVLLLAAHLSAPSPGWREAAEGVASVLIIGAMALWVRVNRLALLRSGESTTDGESLRVWVAHSPQPLPRGEGSLAGIEGN